MINQYHFVNQSDKEPSYTCTSDLEQGGGTPVFPYKFNYHELTCMYHFKVKQFTPCWYNHVSYQFIAKRILKLVIVKF